MQPILKNLKKLRLPSHHESNIPLVTFMAKLGLLVNPIWVIFDNKAFKPCKCSWYTNSLRLLALSTLLLHLILCIILLFGIQYFQSHQSDENWKSIFIMYCITLFGATSFAVVHVNRVEKELIK